MKTKKICNLILIMLIAATLLSACGSTPNETLKESIPLEIGDIQVERVERPGYIYIRNVHYTLYEKGKLLVDVRWEGSDGAGLLSIGRNCFNWERPENAISCMTAGGAKVWTVEKDGEVVVNHTP